MREKESLSNSLKPTVGSTNSSDGLCSDGARITYSSLLFFTGPKSPLSSILFLAKFCRHSLMSSSAAVFAVSTSGTTSSSLHRTRSNHGGVALVPKEAAPFKSGSCSNLASSNIFITTRKRRNYYSSGVKRFSPVMEWQHCTVKKEIDVPTSVAYQCYADREAIPNWMPFISSVKILEDKPDLSRWSLKYTAFGRDLEFAWIARNMQPILNQKIHWRSLEGLPNRGAVRFFPKGSSSCLVELTVSYEVPQLLAPVASALQPFLEGLLGRGLERFATYVKSYSTDSTS